jgi:predicted Zn finger-like uncharacterized protein
LPAAAPGEPSGLTDTMALGARCPNCQALFRVAADQLKLRGGLVRCGACQQVFDAIGTLSYLDDASLPTCAQAPAPSVGAVIAAIRKAESAAGGAMATETSPILPPPSAAHLGSGPRPPAGEPSAAVDVPTRDEATAGNDGRGDLSSEAGTPPPPAITATDDATADHAASADTGQAAAVIADRPDTPAVDEAAAAAAPAMPAFLRQASARRSRTRRILLGAGAAVLLLLMLAQLAAAFRAEILVRFPQTRPALDHLCQLFRCTVGWPARGDLLAVVGSELQALPGTSAFELHAVVRNRGSITVALPAIELTLSDTLNRTLVRKVFAPTDYLAAVSDPQAYLLAGLEPGADLTIRVAFEARGVNAAGFVVYPFYL